jgi:hypothetical protein
VSLIGCRHATFTALIEMTIASDAIDINLTPEEMKYLEGPYKAKGVVGHK